MEKKTQWRGPVSNLKVKYWAGWLNSTNMNANPVAWMDIWSKKAKEAEDNDAELVVFRLPKNRQVDSEAIQEIEAYLQDKYGK